MDSLNGKQINLKEKALLRKLREKFDKYAREYEEEYVRLGLGGGAGPSSSRRHK